jgi:hypothetical protein
VSQSLDDYRTQILTKLKVAADPAAAQELISEVDLVLMHSQMSDQGMRTFWAALRTELDGAVQSTRLLERHAATALEAVLTAAQSAILEFESMVAADDESDLERKL